MTGQGFCLIVEWFDNLNPDGRHQSIYYPLPRCESVWAEDYVRSWFKSRRATVREITWGWAVLPRTMPKSRFQVIASAAK